jgi:tripartite-type tricarboxylate transporter receptor subunit TctC
LQRHSQAPVWAQNWPVRPVTIVVPTTAGSGLDTIARFLAQGLRERAGQPFIIENKAGAGGNIGAQYVARAAPDGYTAFFATHSTHCINPHVLKDSIDPVKDFQPVTTLVAIGLSNCRPAAGEVRTGRLRRWKRGRASSPRRATSSAAW